MSQNNWKIETISHIFSLLNTILLCPEIEVICMKKKESSVIIYSLLAVAFC